MFKQVKILNDENLGNILTYLNSPDFEISVNGNISLIQNSIYPFIIDKIKSLKPREERILC